MQRLLAAFTAKPLDNPNRDAQTTDASVVGMWEDILADKGLTTSPSSKDGTVGANKLVLSCASPALRRMLHPTSGWSASRRRGRSTRRARRRPR